MRIRPSLVLLGVMGYFACLLVLASVLTRTALADGAPGLAVQRVDATQFPTVRAYVSVANGAGVPITGLDTQAFQVQEDGKPVDGLQVESIVDSTEPIAIALVIDTSGSMEGAKLTQAKLAMHGLLDALGPNDRVTIVRFSDEVNVLQERTADRDAAKAAIDRLAAKGNTRLYDAVAESARRLAQQPERRRVLFVLTDGEDTQSSTSFENSLAAATGAGTPVYAIGLGDEVSHDVLDKLASTTGGQSVYVDDPNQLRSTFLSLADQLRRLYVIRYGSALGVDQKPHGLAIQVGYAGLQTTGLGSFTIAAPAEATVTGLSPSMSANGVQHVVVDVPNGAQLVQLFVDDQPRGVVRGAPYVFDWDTTRETAGAHRVVVRITDLQGGSSDKTYPVTVVAADAAPTPATPVAQATPASVATAAPTAVPPTPTPNGLPDLRRQPAEALLPAAVLLLLLACGVGAWILADPRRRSAPTSPAASDDDRTVLRSDLTEVVHANGAVDAEATFVRSASSAQPPARLVIARGGEQREVELVGTELTIGRDETSNVALKDSRASRAHCRIARENGLFWVEDLRSLNGTLVNGEPVSRRQLANGDRITVGDTVVTFLANDAHR